MAKQAKRKQTDYTKGGRDISNTAIPIYQDTLEQIGDYNRDQGIGTINNYLDTYWGNNAIQQSDFLRDYNRAMSGLTNNNYSSTNGGYTSTGQKSYDDQQRYYNDLAARMQSQGLNYASTMANNYYQGLLNGSDRLNAAYRLGKEYSDIDQYNDLVDQSNSNWLSNAMTSVGKGLALIPTPVTQGIGAALGAAGNFINVDTSGAMASLYGAGQGQLQQQYQNQQANNNSIMGNALGVAGNNIYDYYLKKKAGKSGSGSAPSSAVGSEIESQAGNAANLFKGLSI